MALAAPSRDAPLEIEQAFQLSLYLLIVVGFAALAATGKLDLVSLLFVSAALLLRAILLLRHRRLQLPRRLTFWLALGYAPLFFLDFYFFAHRDFVAPAVHLVLYSMSVKLFNIERDRDYLYLAVLSFLMVLSAAILTVDSTFLAAFVLFLLLAIFSFMTMELRRSARASSLVAVGEPSPRRLSAALARTTLLLSVGVAGASTLLFFLLPRVGGGYLSRYTPADAISTGFSDTVNLGEIGRIQQSSEVVAHVRIDDDANGSHDLRLRGAVLTQFDGQRWTAARRAADLLNRGNGRLFQLASSELTAPSARIARGTQPELIHYRVLLEPLATNVVFAIPAVQAIFGPFRQIAVDADQSIRNYDHERTVASYEGVADLSLPPLAALENTRAPLPADMPPLYLQLPPTLDPRIRALAHQITAMQPSPYRKAFAIERYLSTHYGYTLQLPSVLPDDPVADFLFHRRRGHCEYFSSAMALLLRAAGIPSRVVNGFHGAEFNTLNHSYIVRARDAHSWTEAYIAGVGWMTFDPTPAAVLPPPSLWDRLQLYLDASHEFWREWVVNYDASHQQTLSATAMHQTRRRWLELLHQGRRSYQRLLDDASHLYQTWQNPAQLRAAAESASKTLSTRTTVSQTRRRARNRQAFILFVAVALAFFLLWRYRPLGRSLKPAAIATLSCQRLHRHLARCGYRRLPTQTVAEFAASIANPALRRAVEDFNLAYEQARFAHSPQAAATLSARLAAIRKLKASSPR